MGIKMSRFASVVGGLLLGCALTLTASAYPQAKKDKDKDEPPPKKKGDADGKNGMKDRARWEWQLLDEKGKTAQVGTFMGYLDGTLKQGKDQKQIGTSKEDKDKIKATITEGPLKGVLTLTLVDRKPLKYNGELVRSDGTKAKLVLEIIND